MRFFRTAFIYAALLTALCSPAPLQAEEPSGPEITLTLFELTKGRLAFVFKKSGSSDIWVIDFSTLVVRPLARTAGEDNSPAWSPDGQTLVFDSVVDDHREIFTIRADGTALTRLTNSKGDDRDPDWSPDGSHIVFSSSRLGQGADLYSMKADGTGATLLSTGKRKPGAKQMMPAWSPRGGEILFSTNEDWPGWDIQLYDIAEKKAKLLTTGYRSFSRPHWYPDGSSFVFCYGSADEIDIWAFKKGAKEMLPLIKRPGKDIDPVWSDDGTTLFFTAETELNKGDFQLFMWDAAKGKTVSVATGQGAMFHPTWTPLPVRPAQPAVRGNGKSKQD